MQHGRAPIPCVIFSRRRRNAYPAVIFSRRRRNAYPAVDNTTLDQINSNQQTNPRSHCQFSKNNPYFGAIAIIVCDSSDDSKSPLISFLLRWQ